MCRVAKKVRATYGDDGAVVLAIHTGQILRLNQVGAFIFERLEREQEMLDIEKDLSTHFGIPWEIARQDLRAFVQRLAELELLEPNAKETGEVPANDIARGR